MVYRVFVVAAVDRRSFGTGFDHPEEPCWRAPARSRRTGRSVASTIVTRDAKRFRRSFSIGS